MSCSREIENQWLARKTLVSAWRIKAAEIFEGIDQQNRLAGLRDGLLSFNQEPEATEKEYRPHVRDLIKLKVVLFLDVWKDLATESGDEEVLGFVRNETGKLSEGDEEQAE